MPNCKNYNTGQEKKGKIRKKRKEKIKYKEYKKKEILMNSCSMKDKKRKKIKSKQSHCEEMKYRVTPRMTMSYCKWFWAPNPAAHLHSDIQLTDVRCDVTRITNRPQ